MLVQIFGVMLYYPESDCLIEFPSPESLQHRIIISTKPPKEYLESRPKGSLSTGRIGIGFSEEEGLLRDLKVCLSESEADDRVRHIQIYGTLNLLYILPLTYGLFDF